MWAEARWNQTPSEICLSQWCDGQKSVDAGHSKMISAFSLHRWVMLGIGFPPHWIRTLPDGMGFRRRCRSKTWRLTSARATFHLVKKKRVTFLEVPKWRCCQYGGHRSDLEWFGVTLGHLKPGFLVDVWTYAQFTKKNHIEYLNSGGRVKLWSGGSACVVGWEPGIQVTMWKKRTSTFMGIFINMGYPRAGRFISGKIPV